MGAPVQVRLQPPHWAGEVNLADNDLKIVYVYGVCREQELTKHSESSQSEIEARKVRLLLPNTP